MARMTEAQRTKWATRPDLIPDNTTCDHCTDTAKARGTDGRRAFAFCADHYLADRARFRANRPTRTQLIANVNAAIA